MAGMFNVDFSQEAEWDVDEIVDWYETQKNGLGQVFFNELEKVTIALVRNPFMYPEHLLFIRKALMKNFAIMYFM